MHGTGPLPPLGGPSPTDTLTLGFQPPELRGPTFLWLKPHRPGRFPSGRHPHWVRAPPPPPVTFSVQPDDLCQGPASKQGHTLR